MDKGWVVLCQALFQSITKEEWKDTREKLKEFSHKIVGETGRPESRRLGEG